MGSPGRPEELTNALGLPVRSRAREEGSRKGASNAASREYADSTRMYAARTCTLLYPPSRPLLHSLTRMHSQHHAEHLPDKPTRIPHPPCILEHPMQAQAPQQQPRARAGAQPCACRTLASHPPPPRNTHTARAPPLHPAVSRDPPAPRDQPPTSPWPPPWAPALCSSRTAPSATRTPSTTTTTTRVRSRAAGGLEAEAGAATRQLPRSRCRASTLAPPPPPSTTTTTSSSSATRGPPRPLRGRPGVSERGSGARHATRAGRRSPGTSATRSTTCSGEKVWKVCVCGRGR
jgi:hypothetical protein